MQKILIVLLITLILSATLAIGQKIQSSINQPSPSQNLPASNQNITTQPVSQITPNTQGPNVISNPFTMNNVFLPSKGQLTIKMPQITITKDNGITINANDIQITKSYDNKTPIVNHQYLEVVIKNIQTTNTSFPINGSVRVNSTIDNVNFDAFQKLILVSKSMQDPNISPEAKQAKVTEVLQLIPQLVTNGTNINIDENYTASNGSAINSIKVNYPTTAPLPQTPAELFNHLTGSIYIKIAVPLFNDYLNQLTKASTSVNPVQTIPPNQSNPLALTINSQSIFLNLIKDSLDSFIKQGYIVNENNNYIFFLTFENGVIRINGKIVNTATFNGVGNRLQ